MCVLKLSICIIYLSISISLSLSLILSIMHICVNMYIQSSLSSPSPCVKPRFNPREPQITIFDRAVFLCAFSRRLILIKNRGEHTERRARSQSALQYSASPPYSLRTCSQRVGVLGEHTTRKWLIRIRNGSLLYP